MPRTMESCALMLKLSLFVCTELLIALIYNWYSNIYINHYVSSLDCYSITPQLEWSKQQIVIFLEFWRLEHPTSKSNNRL